MKHHTNAQGSLAVAITAEQGGGTFYAGTLQPFTPEDGYAVGIGGAAFPAEAFTAEVAAWLLAAVAAEYRTQFVGTWLHEGKVYIDAVRYFLPDERVKAEVVAINAGQLAIFDFATKTEVTL